jgi:hypothetical protein
MAKLVTRSSGLGANSPKARCACTGMVGPYSRPPRLCSVTRVVFAWNDNRWVWQRKGENEEAAYGKP